MIVIGLETSSSTASVAIAQDQQILAETALKLGAVYAEQLPGLIQRSLKEAGLTIQDVDGLAVSIGPGSYTGLRVGLSLIKGLAFAGGKPIAAVPTPDAVAWNLPYCRLPVQVLLDARRGRVYAAQYDVAGGRPQRTADLKAATVEEIVSDIQEPVVFAGSGAEVYRADIQAALGDRAQFPPPGTGRLQASAVVSIGAEALERGEQASLYDLEPLYLRPPIFARQPAARAEYARKLSEE